MLMHLILQISFFLLQVMYHGATEAVLPWLASLGHKCPPNFNPADFMASVLFCNAE